MILCNKAKAANATQGPRVSVLCIERDTELFQRLKSTISGFDCAEAKCHAFDECVDEICAVARGTTVFLYVDPWSVSQIRMNSIVRLASRISQAKTSVELLMNFNTPIFGRWALATMSLDVPPVDTETEDSEDQEPIAQVAPSYEKLDKIVGGDWWRDTFGQSKAFPDQVQDAIQGVRRELRRHFDEVCWVAIKKRVKHQIPKYHMVFGSRHPDALELMNDAMVKARGHSDFEVDLFAADELDSILLSLASDWIPRSSLILEVIRRIFCNYYRFQIRGQIESLLKEGRLESETGRTRINDSVRVRRSG